mmetsp:Transcript_8109/g.20744  ORF Transcript_8109/g.20744 Transcript_8109/m.20744 type:complete len:193 (-) Transcript_8109:108-686(-)
MLKPRVLMPPPTVAAVVALLVCGVTGELTATFELRSNNHCFFAATILDELDTGGQRCEKPGLRQCSTTGDRDDRVVRVQYTSKAYTEPPKISLLLINSCPVGHGSTTVQTFALTLQLYSPTEPFAIQRKFCPGPDSLHTDRSCCVLNLCNGRFGEPGSCETPCSDTVLSMAWNVTWDEDVRWGTPPTNLDLW